MLEISWDYSPDFTITNVIAFTPPIVFIWPLTRINLPLLGPCYKTGHVIVWLLIIWSCLQYDSSLITRLSTSNFTLLFHPLFKVLVRFHSHYLFTIGLPMYLGLGGSYHLFKVHSQVPRLALCPIIFKNLRDYNPVSCRIPTNFSSLLLYWTTTTI